MSTTMAIATSFFIVLLTVLSFDKVQGICNEPDIAIYDNIPYLREPRVLKRMDTIAIRGLIKELCPEVSGYSNIWSLEEYDCVNGNSLTHSEFADLILAHTSPTTSNLVIPSYSLEIGCYRFTYGVLMDVSEPGEMEIKSEVYEHINITSGGLRVAMIEGHTTSLTKGFGQTLLLQPSEFSVDLDQRSQRLTDGTYSYYCRRLYESWPPQNTAVPMTRSANSPDAGGCFGTGPGRLDYTGGEYLLDTSYMKLDTIYEIMVEAVSADNRHGNVSLLLTVVSGTLPEPVITLRGGAYFYPDYLAHIFNPTEDIRAIGSCKQECDEVTYKWTLKYFDGSRSELIAFEDEDWQPYVTGEESKALFISKDILEAFPERTRLELTLEVTNIQAVIGKAKVELRMNPPPEGGHCTAESDVVFFLEPIVINCFDWSDDDGVTTYEYFVSIDEGEHYWPVSRSDNRSATFFPPVGNDPMSISVKIQDALGAYTLYELDDFTVYHAYELDNITVYALDNITHYYNIFEVRNLSTEQWIPTFSDLNLTGNPTEITQRIFLEESVYQLMETSYLCFAWNNQNGTNQTITGDVPEKVRIGVAPEQTKHEMLSLLATITPLSIEDVYLISSASTMMARTLDDLFLLELDLLRHIVASTWQYVQSNARALEQGVIVNVADDLMTVLGVILERFASLDTSLEQKAVFSASVMEIMDTISSTLLINKLTEEPATEVTTPYLTKSWQKIRNDPTQERTFRNSKSEVTLPKNIHLLYKDGSTCDKNCDALSINILYTHSNTFNYGGESDRLNAQVSILTITFNTVDNTPLIVRDTPGIVLRMPRETSNDTSNVTNVFSPAPNMTRVMHSVNNTNGDDVIFVSLTSSPEMNRLATYVMLAGFDVRPTEDEYDQVFVFSGNVTCSTPYLEGTLKIGERAVITEKAKVMYLGIYELDEDFEAKYLCDQREADIFDANGNLLPDILTNFVANFSGDYILDVASSTCLYWDFYMENDAWRSDGCTVGANSNSQVAEIITNHLTSFANTWIVPPAPLDFDYIFANADFYKNPTIYVSTIVIYVVFFMLYLWARRKDKKDLFRLGVTALKSNNPRHKYLYEVVVVTGKRSHSGTKSKVSFILSGEEDETEPRTFEDDKRPILERGGTDRFLLAVPRPLGTINYMRIWHDNSGKGNHQSWFLQYIAIRDIQTRERFFFIANQWFSLVDEDGQVDRLLPVAGKEQMQSYSLIFETTAGNNLRDGHLWFSIFTRPAGSRFTCVQRVACGLLILWLQLLVNIMWYKVVPPAASTNMILIGPFAISPAQISIGVQTTLIVLPVTIFVMQLFRKSRLRRKRPSRYAVARKANEKCDDSHRDGSASIYRVERSDSPEENIDRKTPTDTSAVTLTVETDRPRKKQPLLFPWWCIIIAWIVSILSTLAATLFTVFYGIQLGDMETREWLTSTMMSFFTDIILAQPLKVIVLAIVLSFLFKRPDVDNEADLELDEEQYGLKPDEEWLHDFQDFSTPNRTTLKPPDPINTEEIRLKQLKIVQMHSIIREIIMYIMFLAVLLMVGYAGQDQHNFLMTDHYRKLLDTGNRNFTFAKVRSVSNFWRWMRTGFIPAVYPERLYNGDIDTEVAEENLFGDRQSYILGHAVIRQLRIIPESCNVTSEFTAYIPECNAEYSTSDEDRSNYSVSWMPDNGSLIRSEYQYNDAIDSYPYWGRHALYMSGGYVTKLKSNYNDTMEQINQLYEEAWIDKYTRAVFVEMSCYNAQVNLFAAVTFLLEFLPAGGFHPIHRVDTFRLTSYDAGSNLVRLTCEVICLVFTIYFIIKESFAIRKEKKKYLRKFWNWAEWGIIVFSIATVGVYLCRLYVINEVMGKLNESKQSGSFISLQYVAYLNEIYSYMLGWVVFIASLKFMKLLRFNRRIGLLTTTISYAASDLIQFGFMFSILFVAFANVFYLLFNGKLYDYATYINTLETLLSTMLNKFSFSDIYQEDRIMGPLMFFFFMSFISFMLVNVFLTIINMAFKVVQHDLQNQQNDYEILDFMMQHLKTMVGLHTSETKANQQQNEDTSQIDPIDDLPYKVDELLNHFALVYFKDNPTFAKDLQRQEHMKRKTSTRTYGIVSV